MQITDVRVRKVAKEGKLKAVVSITIDDEFVVHDIKVIEGEKGMFIAMPSKKALDGEYRDIAHPINSGTRERIQSTILAKYEESLEDEDSIVVENGAAAGSSIHFSGNSNIISFPLPGCLNSRRYAHNLRDSEVFLFSGMLPVGCPYFLSPTRGQPRCAICTRIW